MQKIKINGNNSTSEIFIGETIKNLHQYIPQNSIIITDKNIQKHYKQYFENYPIIEIGQGENIKTLKAIEDIYQKLVELNADRSSFIVGIGGGIVCDIAGFAASTYMRGLRFGFVSTSLLSQVDASVGGKNGVNFNGFKNIIGTFNQPEFVICDIEMLKTLPKKEILNGFAEIIKHALISDKEMFDLLKNNIEASKNLNENLIQKYVYESVSIKSKIVNADEKERGERRKLNFGHTIGHAIERNSNLSHGVAVSIGMVLASKLSFKKGLISEDELSSIINLLNDFELPTKFTFDKSKILNDIGLDKKREADSIHFVLLKGIGDSVVKKISLEALKKEINDLIK